MGLALGAKLCPSRASAPDLNATNGEKPGIDVPAVPSPSGPKCEGHPVHHTSGMKRLLAAMPACLSPGPFVPHHLSPGEVDVSFSFHRTWSSLIQI